MAAARRLPLHLGLGGAFEQAALRAVRHRRSGCLRHNGYMTELPRKAVSRTARLAALPIGFAGRRAVGLGRRLGGVPAEAVMSDVQQRTAEQLFRTLGDLKGGAMKVGQALSILESALPEDVAAPYRAQLTRLQDSAPPSRCSASWASSRAGR